MAAPAEPPVDELMGLLYEDFEANDVPRLAAAHAAQQQAVADEKAQADALVQAKESAAAAKRAKYGTKEDPRMVEFNAIMAKAGLAPAGRELKPGRLFVREDTSKKVLRIAHPSVKQQEEHAKMTPEQVAADLAAKEARSKEHGEKSLAGRQRVAERKAREAEEAKHAKPKARSLVAIREDMGIELQAYHVCKQLGEDTPKAAEAHEARMVKLQDEELRKIAETSAEGGVASNEALAGLNCPWSPSGTFLPVDLRYAKLTSLQTVIKEAQQYTNALKQGGNESTLEFQQANAFLAEMRAEAKRRRQEAAEKCKAKKKQQQADGIAERQEKAIRDPDNYAAHLKGARELKWWARDGWRVSKIVLFTDPKMRYELGADTLPSDEEQEKEEAEPSGALIPATVETEDL